MRSRRSDARRRARGAGDQVIEPEGGGGEGAAARSVAPPPPPSKPPPVAPAPEPPAAGGPAVIEERYIGEILVRQGALSPDRLEQALEIVREKGVKLRDVLSSTQALDDGAFVEALARELGMPVITRIQADQVPAELIAQVPINFARQHRLLPLGEQDGVGARGDEQPARPVAARRPALAARQALRGRGRARRDGRGRDQPRLRAPRRERAGRVRHATKTSRSCKT